MAFFSFMGQTWYKFKDGSTSLINDITKFVAFKDVWKKDPRTHLTYKIRDGELPHMISNKIYDTVDYWWTILLLNEIYDFDNQWPRSADQLGEYIEKKYPFSNPGDNHHYIAPNGTVVDLLALKIERGIGNDSDAILDGNLYPVTIYDHEAALNEQKRNIKLVDPDYIGLVASEFERLMKNG